MMKVLPTLVLLLLFSLTVHAQRTIVLQPGPDEGKDAMVWDDELYNKANRNYGNDAEMLVHAWTDQGVWVYARSFLEFDLSWIMPTGFLSATMILHNNPEGTFNGMHQPWSGPNRAWIRRVITPWEEDEITWRSQAAYAVRNQVQVPASVDGHQTYTIDVTELVRDMLTDFRNRSHGFVIILEDETPYRALVFATSDYKDAAKHPRLELDFLATTGAETAMTATTMDLEVFPNPASTDASIHAKLPAGENSHVQLLGPLGQVLRSWHVTGPTRLHLPLAGFASGLYWLRMSSDTDVATKPLLVR